MHGTAIWYTAAARCLLVVDALHYSPTIVLRCLQVRELVRGSETVLGDAGADWELFVCDAYSELELAEVAGVCNAQRLVRSWDQSQRIK
jgi:hypothetical protein